jgi:hypothetical protein
VKLIFDLDHHLYRAAASCQPTKAKPFQEGLDEAIWRFESSFNQTLLDLNSDDFELYMSGEGNWRHGIFPEYKANRKDTPRPIWLEDVREHALLKYKAEICNGMEADDMCGIRLTQLGTDAICVSLDKDLLTVPGYHYNFVKKTRILVSPFDALRTFYKQVITGDGTDGVPAFDGKMRSATPQFVQKLLDPLDSMTEEEEMWEYVLDVFCSNVDSFAGNGHGYTLATRNARVLWIQREENDSWQEPVKN